ncbi:MAG: family transporter protein [Marmoricola sp.]|nr:family transporter protein [Marmoricola sp.]
MISLVRVELTRYRSRRVILLLVALIAVATALVAFKSAYDTRPPSANERATAQATAESEAGRADIKNDVASCENDPTQYLGPGTTVQECKDSLTPAGKSFFRAPLDLSGTLKGNGSGVAILVVGLLIIAGSTFAGGDWASGSIRNQVLFEPRRSRLWAAKAIAVALASALIALVVLGAFWLTLYLVASDRGVPHGSAVVGDVGWHLLRAVALAAGAGLGAFALTTIFRHSVATMSLLFAYSVGGELLVLLLPIDGVARWSLGNNAFGWLETRLEFVDPTSRCNDLAGCGTEHISHLGSGLYLLVLLAVACTASWASFRRRDL